MSDKTLDLLLEDRRQAYIRIEQLEQLCRDMYDSTKYGLLGESKFTDRMQALGLLEGEQ